MTRMQKRHYTPLANHWTFFALMVFGLNKK